MFTAQISPDRPASPFSSSISTDEATAAFDVSSVLNLTNDDSPDCGISAISSKYWARVSHLDVTITGESLKSLFFPYGADEAIVVWEGVHPVGYVGFDAAEMVQLACEKMNAFVPFRHSQALHVVPTTLELAMTAARVFSAPHQAFSTGGSANSSAKPLFIDAPSPLCVAQLVEEVKKASPQMLDRLLESVVHSLVALSASFKDQLMRQLVAVILDDTLRADSTSSSNAGTFLGGLFSRNLIQGDPFQLASQALHECGAGSVSQIEGICCFAHACSATTYPISKASFWAQVGGLIMHSNGTIRIILQNHLRKMTLSSINTASALSSTFSPPRVIHSCAKPSSKPSSMTRSFIKNVNETAKTIYFSRLPPTWPQTILMDLVEQFGGVNKVRVCAGNEHATLFSFVEMETAEAAMEIIRFDHFDLYGARIRVQPARTPIQDVTVEDALVGLKGERLRPCLFGRTGDLLLDCIWNNRQSSRNA